MLLLSIYSSPANAQTKIWDRTFGGMAYDVFIYYNDPRGDPDDGFYEHHGGADLTSMIATSDGGYLLGGSSDSYSANDKSQDKYGQCDESICPNDFWIVKVDADGNKVWDKTIGGNGYDILTVMIATSDGGFLLGGSSNSGIGHDKTENPRGDHNPIYGTGGDFWLVKIDENGNKLWDKTYGGENVDELQSLVATADGGYLLGGTSMSGISGDKSTANKDNNPNNPLGDYWVVRIDASGNKLWDKTFGGNNYDYLKTIMATADGGFLLGGTSRSGIGGDKTEIARDNAVFDFQQGDYWLVKIDDNGNKVWDKTLGGNTIDDLEAMVAMADGSYLLGGYSESGKSGDKSQAII